MSEEEILDIEFIMEQTFNFQEESEVSFNEEADEQAYVKTSGLNTEGDYEEDESDSGKEASENENLLNFASSERLLSKVNYDQAMGEFVESEVQVDESDFQSDFNSFFSFDASREPSFTEEEGEEEEAEEEESEEDLVPNVTCEQVLVRFTTVKGETMTCKFRINSSIAKVKKRVGKVFKIDTDYFRLSRGGVECNGDAQLSEFDVRSPGILDLDISSVDPVEFNTPGEFSTYHPLLYKLTVVVKGDLGEDKPITILVENQAFVKEWLGGFRNLKTNLKYHHAVVQTLPRVRNPNLQPLNSRQTQTPVFPLKEIALDTSCNKATQMWRTDHFVTPVYDKIMVADPNRFRGKPPFISLSSLTMTVVLVRRMIARLARQRKERLALEEQVKCLRIRYNNMNKARESHLRRNAALITESSLPITRDDFYYLYLVVGKWWRQELEKIKKMKTGSARSAAYKILLEKEIEFLKVIERKRTAAKKEVLRKQDMYFLETCARPIIFCNNRGIMSSIDSLPTQQARELLEIMSSYLNINDTVENRIGVIRTLINQIISLDFFECTAEIVDLLDRECDLMATGIEIKHLKSLQDRILQLMMFYLHFYIVNPSSNTFKKPSMPKYDKKLYLCKQCGKLKPACDYNVHVKLGVFEICYSCEWMKNVGQERVNLTPFARILGYIRQSEMMKCCYSSVCYVLQTIGLHHLVTRIWLGKSILSDKTDLNILRMVRFRKNEDWSPWNCILLTEEESIAHAAIDDVYKFYSDALLQTIYWRHLKAKNHFLPLLLNDRFMRETRIWFNGQDLGNFLLASHINEFAQLVDFEHFDN